MLRSHIASRKITNAISLLQLSFRNQHSAEDIFLLLLVKPVLNLQTTVLPMICAIVVSSQRFNARFKCIFSISYNCYFKLMTKNVSYKFKLSHVQQSLSFDGCGQRLQFCLLKVDRIVHIRINDIFVNTLKYINRLASQVKLLPWLSNPRQLPCIVRNTSKASMLYEELNISSLIQEVSFH